MKRGDKCSWLDVLSAGVLGVTLITVLSGLAMLFAGCHGRATGGDDATCAVNVARAVVHSQKDTSNGESVSPDPEPAGSVAENRVPAYSTTPAVRKWNWTSGDRVNDPADLIDVLTPFAERHAIEPAWLTSRSPDELTALHSDMRENAVQWDCVLRSARQPAAGGKQGRWVTVRQCVKGRCYLQRVWVEE